MVDHHDIVWVIFVPLLLEFCSFSLINCCSLFNGTVCVLIIGVIGVQQVFCEYVDGFSMLYVQSHQDL